MLDTLAACIHEEQEKLEHTADAHDETGAEIETGICRIADPYMHQVKDASHQSKQVPLAYSSTQFAIDQRLERLSVLLDFVGHDQVRVLSGTRTAEILNHCLFYNL